MAVASHARELYWRRKTEINWKRKIVKHFGLYLLLSIGFMAFWLYVFEVIEADQARKQVYNNKFNVVN